MATKRARITDRDPLTATDSVLAGYEQVNKSASQLPEVAVERQSPHSVTSQPVNKSASQQADDSLLTSQQPNQSTSQEVEIVESSDQQPEIDNLASQQVSKSASQQAKKSTSQEVQTVKSSNPTLATDNLASQQPSKSEGQEASKSASQQVSDLISTSQQPDQSGSQEVIIGGFSNLQPELDKSTSEEVRNLESQEVSNSGSQQVSKLASEEVETVGLSGRQPETDNLASQQVSKPTIRKATFQIDAALLEALDRYHLQLQIDLGKRNAPYKEILVEEAIAQWLERAAKSPERAVKSLLKRQEQR